MKYPLEAAAAIAEIVEDPDTAAEVMQSLDHHDFVLIKRPTKKNGGQRRVARLVVRLMRMRRVVKELEEKPGRNPVTLARARAEASALEHVLEDYEIDLNDHDSLVEQLTLGIVNGYKVELVKYLEDHPDVAPRRKTPETHQTPQAAPVRTMAGFDRVRRASRLYEDDRRL